MNADYVIVGGGVFGCALAWELASHGADVTVLEQGEIGSGSSGGLGARGVRADRRDLRELRLAKRATELWETLDERLAEKTGYEQVGGLRLIEDEYVGGVGGRVSLRAHAWMQEQAGIPTRILDRAELLELEPGLSELITHALWVESDGTAPHHRTTRAFADAALRAGASINEQEAAISIEWNGARATGVQTHGRVIGARHAVVLVANAGNATLLGRDVEPVPGWDVVPQAAFVRPRGERSLRHLVNHESRPLSLKTGENGTVQLSGGLRGRWDVQRGEAVVDESLIPRALSDAAAVYPELAEAEVVISEARGPETCSPDGIPVIDRIPTSENVFIASHWTAHGFALVPAVAEALRDWLLSSRQPEILAPFGVARFMSTSSTQGRHMGGHPYRTPQVTS